MSSRWRRALIVMITTLLVSVALAMAASPAQAQIVDGAEGKAAACGVFWPTTGEVDTVHLPGTNGWSATFRFTLTQSQLTALRCVGAYLEIDFWLSGIEVPAEWDGYSISSNISGAIHDVAAEDNGPHQTPAVTRISTGALQANQEYYAMVQWFNTSLRPSEGPPSVALQWVPSHWAQNPAEATVCSMRYTHWAGDAWCIFGTTRVFWSKGAFGGTVPFDGIRYYEYSPSGPTTTTGIITNYPESGASGDPGGGSPPPESIASSDTDNNGGADLLLVTNEPAGSKGFILRSAYTSFLPAQQWWDGISYGWTGVTPLVGDVNGDKKADLVFLTNEGANGTKAFVAISSGSGFNTPQLWWNGVGMMYDGIKPSLGDVDGNGCDDLVIMTNEPTGSKGFTLLSTCGTFLAPQQWWNGTGLGWSGVTPLVSDVTGDKKADLVYLTNEGPNGIKMFVATSTAAGFNASQLWWNGTGLMYSGIKAYLR